MTTRRSTRATLAATIVATALVTGTALSAGPVSAITASRAPAPVTDLVRIHAGVRHLGAARKHPPSLAQCRTDFGVSCYGARQIENAYDLPALYRTGVAGQGQTIVIVDAFGSPTIARDLAVFDRTYHLAAPPSLKRIRPAGSFTWEPNPTDVGWAGETTLDVEYAHAVAPRARILLVETPKSEEEGRTGFPQIVKAEKYVVDHHLGGVISQSFSATEATFPTAASLRTLRGAYLDAAAKGVTVLAASGDSGAADVRPDEENYYLRAVTSWPDSDPLVSGIGGTTLDLDSTGSHMAPDVAWNDTYDTATQQFIFGGNGPNPLATGGGLSTVFPRPSYQDGVASVVGRHRGVPDISMSGSCSGAVNAFQSFPGQAPGWYPVCGTSEATPLFSGIVALADQAAGHTLGAINPALYRLSAAHAPGLVDVTSGNNTVSFPQHGTTYTVQGFPARPGYDLSTGVGTVDARLFVPELAQAAG